MIIKRYLRREVVLTLSAVTMVLLLAFISQQLVRYLNMAAIGKISTNILLILVGFEIPYLLALLLPLALYLGILLAFGRLYTNHEMEVMQMSGFGFKRLLSLTAGLGFMVASMVLVLMLWVNPAISAKRQQMLSQGEATLHLIQTLVPGRFQVSPDGRHVMYVEKLSRDHKKAENVFLAQELKPTVPNANPTWMLVLADLGYQSKEDGLDFFVTENGYRYEGIPGQNDYKIIQFKRYAVRIPEQNTQISHEEVEAKSILALWQAYDDPKQAAELQWRFSIPIATFLLSLLALPFSKVKPRQSRYIALLPAILIYILYINILSIARHWLEQGDLPIFPGLWWVHVIACLLIGFSIMFSARQWRS